LSIIPLQRASFSDIYLRDEALCEGRSGDD
jgi:hypothetical protein